MGFKRNEFNTLKKKENCAHNNKIMASQGILGVVHTCARTCPLRKSVRLLSKKLPFNWKSGTTSVVLEARKTSMDGINSGAILEGVVLFTVQISWLLLPYTSHPSCIVKNCSPYPPKKPHTYKTQNQVHYVKTYSVLMNQKLGVTFFELVQSLKHLFNSPKQSQKNHPLMMIDFSGEQFL